MNIGEMLARQKVKVYAGVGSRKTPTGVLGLMTKISRRLDRLGWRLRTGGAEGADTAFEEGAKPGNVDLFLPKPGFNGRLRTTLAWPTKRARELSRQYHPEWASLSAWERMLHARNVHQILGANCDSPAAFVVCWTPDGATTKTTSKTGGTGQAIRVANAFGVPVFNLALDEHRDAWASFAAPRKRIIRPCDT